jgi:methyl-accepting chemotaxis protein
MGAPEPTTRPTSGRGRSPAATVGAVGIVAWLAARGVLGAGDVAAFVGLMAAALTAGIAAGRSDAGLKALGSAAAKMTEDPDARAPALPGVVGVVAASMNRLADRASSASAAATDAAATSRWATAVVAEAREHARIQGELLDATAAALNGWATSMTSTAAAAALSTSVEDSGHKLLQITTTSEGMGGNTVALADAIAQTSSSVEEMIYAIKEVARNIEDLARAAEQTSASMNEMEANIQHVEENATATARLSEDVIRDAARGAAAVKRTLQGVDEIRASARAASDVMRALGERIGTIGNILDVIDDVAEQTNLLALNAAIIAAQAGEHGRGFAVVADEIKDLAERTAASTKEIAALILGVQAESKNAIAAIMRGERSVESGVQLSQAAEGALAEIVDSAGKATEMVRAIAQATVEQSKGSKLVADAVDRIARTVQQVAAATAEQARGSEHIVRSIERMKTSSHHVELSSREQSQGSSALASSIEHIRDVVHELQSARQAEVASCQKLLVEVERLQEGHRRQLAVLARALPPTA